MRLWNQKEVFENLPEEIKRIVMLMAHKVGGIWAKVYLDKSYHAFFYRKKRWIRDYIIFSHLQFKLKLKLEDIFQKIGYLKNGKKKKEFQIFEYIWNHPFCHSYDIAKKFKVTDVWVRRMKKRYLDRMKEYANDQDMWMLLYYFDRCVFKPQGRLGKKSTISERKAKERIEK